MTDAFDEQLPLARVYARSLYELAEEAGTVAAVRAELDELQRMMTDDAAFAEFMTSVAIDPDARERSLEKVFRGKLSDLTLNTLQIMNRHGRVGLVTALHRAFVLIDEVAHNQVECVARTAVELDDAQKDEVRRVAAKVSGKEPLVTFVVDDEMLGGLVLEIEDWRYDASLRRQLTELKRNLFDRSARGLPVGTVEV